MIVGVTGGVGSGKTVFARDLGTLGARVIEVDDIARNLVEKREDIREALRRKFGSEIFDEAGRLRRRLLGRIVFSDTRRLNALNRILQPLLVNEVRDRISHYQKKEPAGLIVVDMAILYEARVEPLFDMVVVMTAPLEKRIEWLSADRGWSREEVVERIRSQMDDREKMKRANVVIENSGTLEDLRYKAIDLYRQLSL